MKKRPGEANRAIISVFGSSLPPPNSPDYQHAQHIGQTLANVGYTVMSGGYGGVMAGVSQGAAEAGGNVIGVTCKQLEMLSERKANRWLSERIEYLSLSERLRHLIDAADGYVICSGGYGTLHEIASVLEGMRVRDIPRKPIVCFSHFWQPLMKTIMTSAYIPASDRNLLQFAENSEQMLHHLTQEH